MNNECFTILNQATNRAVKYVVVLRMELLELMIDISGKKQNTTTSISNLVLSVDLKAELLILLLLVFLVCSVDDNANGGSSYTKGTDSTNSS